MILELAKLEINERHRDSDRRSLARLARNHGSRDLLLTLRQLVSRSRRRTLQTAA